MSIITKIKDWWELLDEDEQKTMKIVGVACLIGVPLVIGLNILLIPYVYPALAAFALTIGIVTGIGYAALLLLKHVAPIVLKHYDSEPTVESVTHTAPAKGFEAEATVTVTYDSEPSSSISAEDAIKPEHQEGQRYTSNQ